MSSPVAGPDAVACLERILEAQVRLVELQEAQVRLLERCAAAPPPPQAAGLPSAAGPGEAPPPPARVLGEAAVHRMLAPADGERPPAPPAGPAAGFLDIDSRRPQALGEVGKGLAEHQDDGPPARVPGEAAAHCTRAPAGGERPPLAGLAAQEGVATAGQEGNATAGLRRLSEEVLVCGAWEPEITHHQLVRRNSRRPDRIPVALVRFFIFLGVLSPLEICAGWRRSVYRVYQAYIPCSVIFSLVIDAVRIYVVLVVIGTDLDGSNILSYVFSVHARLFIVLPCLFVWRHQFSARGGLLELMCSMDERQIPWHQFTKGLRIVFCVMVCFTAVAHSLTLWADDTPSLAASLGLQSASSASLCLGLANSVMHLLFVLIFMGSHYLVWFCSTLHRHDLLCYARAVVTAMEGDGVASDVVPSLNKLELLISARLRHASQTWVRFTVYEIIAMGSWALISAMYLLSGTDVSWWLTRLVFTSTIVVVLLDPLASVAETFDYDVLRALNHPSILMGAQKYVGQQLLSHLSSLGWGFRIGGVVISNDFVAKIAFTLAVGVLTTVSSSIQSEFGSALF